MTLKNKQGISRETLRIQLINKLVSAFTHLKYNNAYNVWISNHKYRIKSIKNSQIKLSKISEISWKIKELRRDNFKQKKTILSRKLGKLLNKIVKFNKASRKLQQYNSRYNYKEKRNNQPNINRLLTSITKAIVHQKKIE